MKSFRSIRRVLLVLACALILNGLALVAIASSVGIAGREIFPGIHYRGVTYGASFVGRTATAGAWAASINYFGTAGLGSAVSIVGGSWTLANADGSRVSGRVVRGSVAWPANLSTNIGCGDGIAVFTASLSNGGFINGCLDDTHFATVFPPTIVGTLTLP